MASSWGYRSYRGRGGNGKPLLAVLLVLVILAAGVVIYLQNNIVYDETGTPHLENPWQQEKEETSEIPEDLDLVIQEPEPLQQPQPEVLQVCSVPAGTLTQAACDEALSGGTWDGCDGAAVTLKDAAGTVYFDASVAVSGATRTEADTADALAGLTGETGPRYTIARLSCFHDPKAANSDVENLGLKNTGGYIFYDGNNSQWLDPAKPAARQYLYELAKEAAELGFDEIMLTDVSYPTVGKLNKIAYGDTARNENLALFLEELRAALEPYSVKLSIEVPADVVTNGSDDVSGLVLAEIAGKVDRIYAVTDAAQAETLAAAVAAVSETVDFIPELTARDDTLTGNYLLLASS
jgi:hypothetical protein